MLLGFAVRILDPARRHTTDTIAGTVVGVLLDQFDGAVKLVSHGRAAPTGATRQLNELALEAGRIARATDARAPGGEDGGTPVAGADVSPAA
jgi:hypothetical protein